MKYTPAPWIINTNVRTAINAGEKHIAMVSYFQSADEKRNITKEEHEANARLISAAPVMYSMLDEVCVFLEGNGRYEFERDAILELLEEIRG